MTSSLDLVTAPMPRRRWSREHLEELARRYEAGEPVKEIAAAMRVSIGAVVGAARKTGLRHPNAKGR